MSKIQNLSKEKGITLVALVVTIVILIILSTVAINAIFGDNGLIKRAEEAKNMTEGALKNENQEITNAVAYMNEILDENDKDELEDIRKVEGVTIPDGFYYVGGTKTEGIVISDNKEDLQRGTNHDVAKTLKGNQFVWVPVENDNDFKRYDGYFMGDLESNIISGMFNNCSEPYTKGYATEKAEYDEMKNSVLENNGFYVGRYETGTKSNIERNEESGIEDKTVVKQGFKVYNYIAWSNSDDMTNEIGGAVEKAKKFAKDNNYKSVTSTLIYGVQWDAIMNWIDPLYKNGSCDTNKSYVANSTGRGNYNEEQNTNPWKGNVTITGATEEYSIKNIYDLAGNVYEWTMEAVNVNGTIERRIKRGGRNYNRTVRRSNSYWKKFTCFLTRSRKEPVY